MPTRSPRPTLWRLTCLVGDLAIAAAAFLTAFWVRASVPLPLTRSVLPMHRLEVFLPALPLFLLTQIAALYALAFYDPSHSRARWDVVQRLATAISLQTTLLIGYYFLRGEFFVDATDSSVLAFPRSVILLIALIDFALLYLWRRLMMRLIGVGERRVAIIGVGRDAREMAHNLLHDTTHHLRCIGFIATPDTDAPELDPEDPPILGSIEELAEIIERHALEEVFLTSEQPSWQSELVADLGVGNGDRPTIWLLPTPFESLLAGTRYHWIQDLPVLEVSGHGERRIQLPIKRALDFTLAAGLLLVTVPVLGVAALAVRLTSAGPVLYRQRRIGLAERPFVIRKLRTMYVRADSRSDDDEPLAQPGDPRVTPLGAWLRRFRIDELPQLWNVLEGTMSLVGPRPERPGPVDRFRAEVRGYSRRFTVRPGVTGLAQIHGTYYSTPHNKIRYDLAYIANWSIWLDLHILVRTVKVVLTSRGS